MPFDDPFRTYVIDTSVLLSDPHAILRFDEHEVVLPAVVIAELEGKRTHPELGYFARTALRLLDDLRISAGRLDQPRTPGQRRDAARGTQPRRSSILPSGFQIGDNDTRILAVARNLAAEGHHVVVVSEGLAVTGQGLGGGPDRRGVPRRAGRNQRMERIEEVDVAAQWVDGVVPQRHRRSRPGAGPAPATRG